MDQRQPIPVALGPILSDPVLPFVPDDPEDVTHGDDRQLRRLAQRCKRESS